MQRSGSALPATVLAMVLGLSSSAGLHAQQSSQPPASTPTPQTAEWKAFIARSGAYQGNRITVVRSGHNVSCKLDAVTPEGLYCHESLHFVLPIPGARNRFDYRVLPEDVVTVRRPDRALSTLIGFGVGFGLGAGAAAAHNTYPNAADVAGTGLYTGALTAVIGYSLPLVHHTLYRARRR